MKSIKTFTCKSHTDQATGSMCDKINGFGRRILSCHAKVSLIFALLVIPNKQHAPGSYLFHSGRDIEMSGKDARWIGHKVFHPSLNQKVEDSNSGSSGR